MPVVVLLGGSRRYLEELSSGLSVHFSVVHMDGEFRTIRSRLSNMEPDTVYVVENCDTKPQRYEIYCLAKKNGTSYCILSDSSLSASKHDSHVFNVGEGLPLDEILCLLGSNLSCGTAHRKKIVGPNYLMQLKQIINRVNEEMPRGCGMVLRDCEDRIMRMVRLNPMRLEGIEEAYRDIVQNELQDRGLGRETG